MYSPEILKRLNAETSLQWPEKVNGALVAIKGALRQVAEVDAQIEAARQLKEARPELAKQLELTEKFYIARREALLDLEEPVSTLAGIREALASLLNRYETERFTLEGRPVLEEHRNGGSSEASINAGDEILPRLTEVSQRCEKIAVTIRQVKEALQEYSIFHSKAPLISSNQAGGGPGTGYFSNTSKTEVEPQ
jgi:hypothetical protein